MTSKSFPIELDAKGDAVLDARKLVDTRMLIAGSSGSGKSYVMRVIAEQAAGRLQTIVLDPEGEYTTLREKVDVLIVGQEGEVLPTVPTAAKLARKLLELQVSAVIDLYDLKIADRRAFVRRFLDSLMSVPKKLWRPCLVMLDEAHKFCPERSSGSAESTDSVITLLSQGRKRGFCGILSTQRLQKLHKDAAAETLNNLIGRTSLDTDVRRARDILGLAKADEGKLRALKPGNWFGFGPAFAELDGVCTFKGRRAQTTHPQAGNRQNLRPPAPSARIRKVLPELAELPQEVAQEIDDFVAARKRVAELERELRSAQRTQRGNATVVKHVGVEQIKKEVERALAKQKKAYEKAVAQVGPLLDSVDKHASVILSSTSKVRNSLLPDVLNVRHSTVPTLATSLGPVASVSIPQLPPPPPNGTVRSAGGGKRRILVALASAGEELARPNLAIIAHMAPKSGTFGDYLSRLKSGGYIVATGSNCFEITDAGLDHLGSFDPIPLRGPKLISIWQPLIGHDGGKRRIFDALAEAGMAGLDRTALAEAAGLEPRSGTFGDYLSRLRRKGVVYGSRHLQLARVFFV